MPVEKETTKIEKVIINIKWKIHLLFHKPSLLFKRRKKKNVMTVEKVIERINFRLDRETSKRKSIGKEDWEIYSDQHIKDLIGIKGLLERVTKL